MSREHETVSEVFARQAYEEPLHHVGTVTESDEKSARVSNSRWACFTGASTRRWRRPVASVATSTLCGAMGRSAPDSHNSASFLRPITAGAVDVIARCRHHDDQVWLWSHEFRDDQDRLCAIADVTIAVRPLAQIRVPHDTPRHQADPC